MAIREDNELGKIAHDLAERVRWFTRAYTAALLGMLAAATCVVITLGFVVERQGAALRAVHLSKAVHGIVLATHGFEHDREAEQVDILRDRLLRAAEGIDTARFGSPDTQADLGELTLLARKLAAAPSPIARTDLRERILEIAEPHDVDTLTGVGSAPNMDPSQFGLGGWRFPLAALLPLGLFVIGALIRRVHTPLTETLTLWKDEFVQAGNQVERALMFDQMTGLPTRRNLMILLADARESQGPDDEPLALIHFDLVKFREVNDSIGHEAADRVVLRVAQLLNLATAKSDLVARIAGDEFVVVTHGDEEHVLGVADDLVALIETPIEVDDQRAILKCNVGIAFDSQTETVESLIANAELALWSCKVGGTRKPVIYTADLRENRTDRREIEHALKVALANDEIEPFFQPQVDARSGRVVGFEALARWRHREQGILSPQHFLGIAEEAGLIRDLSRVMVRKSLDTLAFWNRLGLDVPQVSLNFTAGELRDPGFVEMLLFDTDKAGLRPENICVELLESAMIDDEDDPVISTLSRLTDVGFLVELDDFGTSHASISNLRRFQVSGMKIDRSFVQRMTENEDQQKLTHAMLSLAGSLQIGSLAEGVESEAERDMLIAMGCERLQGFGIAKPMSRDDATAWLRNYQRGSARGFGAKQAETG